MSPTRLVSLLTAAAVTGTAALTAAPAQAAPTGSTSLAKVLAADGNRYDRNWNDFDILEKAIGRVMAKKASSDVAVLADGSTPLTAFVPTDRAFRNLVRSLAGEAPKTERAVFRAVRSAADVDTLETILLYHVVPGATITYAQAKRADGTELDTAQGGTLTVQVADGKVRLRDADPDAADARVIASLKNVNKGNKQIAHGINRVLRPVDL
jgi:uncharacterized surface protein with fasciclin (FAS1) repeats